MWCIVVCHHLYTYCPPPRNLCPCRHVSGESVAAKRAKRLLLPEESSVWSGPKAKSLFQEGTDRWLVFSRCSGAWQRTLRWVTEYEGFSRGMCVDSQVTFSWYRCLADNTLCYLFLVEVANEDKGSTRPVAARRALSR